MIKENFKHNIKRGGVVPEPIVVGARIKVVGVGGSGSNAVDHMIDSGVNGVDFIEVNCDVQDLHNNKADTKIHIGKNLTKGLGAGMNPEIGRQAAEETRSEIQDALKGADLVFITCGLGGGTGTGAAPVVAEAAKQQGILTIAVVTKPFSFEGSQRLKIAEEGLKRLIEVVDTVIVIPNDRLLEISNQKTTLRTAFAMCDDVLKNAVQGISELIIKPGIINLDFADVRTIMAEAGPAIMGIGQSTGDARAVEAARKAINSPLLDVSIEGAKGVLFAVTGGEDMTLFEVNEAAKIITASVDPDAKIIFGAIHDEGTPKGAIKITIIATGFTDVSSNVIAGSSKTMGIRHEEQSDEDKSGNFEDMKTPAFLRKEKERPFPQPKPNEEERKRKTEIGDIRRKPASNTFLENYICAYNRGAREKREQALAFSLAGGYRTRGYNESARPAMAGRDFNKEGNFRAKAIKVFKITFSILKKTVEALFTIILVTIAMIAFGIYKAGSIVRGWFQRTI